jgi:hypothetical protein
MANDLATRSSDIKPTNYTGGTINSPQLSEKGVPKTRSIKDTGQAQNVVRTLQQANRQRQIINNRIMAKFNAEKPYDTSKLEAEGLGWRSNFTTKPLPLMVDKVAPRFVEAVQGLKYFTNSALNPKWDRSTEKTEQFRKGLTDLIRNRKGWRNFLENVAQDNALFGFTVPAWLDEFTWFAKYFRQDEIYLSSGTRQLPNSAQCVVLREVFYPHELFEQLKDREVADMAGWNLKNCFTAINEASPAQWKNQWGNSLDVMYQNMLRELTTGFSYQDGTSIINVYSVLAQEVDGSVSHYRLAGNDLLEIFTKEDRFKSMNDCLAFFAFQKGNDTMQGSKGIGREIYELAGMQDRIRNEVVDRSILSGKTLIQGNIRDAGKFKMSVVGMACLVPSGWQVLEQKIDGNVEPFLRLDAYFGLLVDQLIGSVSPRQLEGERVTKAQVDLFASREEEGKDARISRFLHFFTDMVSTMQRRACDKDTIEEDAKEFQKQMLESMSREELDELANQPVAQTIKDLTPLRRQLIVSLASEKRGNPLYNQRQLELEDLSARLDDEFARKVLLPENDPTESAEQSRLQQLEILMLEKGQAVPVSPRDNHELHLKIVIPLLEGVAGAIATGGTGTETLEAFVAHAGEHLARYEAQGGDKALIKSAKALLNKANAALGQLKMMDEQAAQISAESEQLTSEDAQGMNSPQGGGMPVG